MNRKNLFLVVGAALLGGILAMLGGMWRWTEAADILSAPARWIGIGLRKLSMSGTCGNLAAWFLVLAVCALPVLLIFWNDRQKKKRGMEDWLVGLMIPILFALLFFSVNPTLLSHPFNMMFPLAASGCLLSIVTAWLVLKALRGMEQCSQWRLLKALYPLLTSGAVILSFAASAVQLSAFVTKSQRIVQGNTGDMRGAFLTCAVLLVLTLLELTPYVLGAVTLLWDVELTREMEATLFSSAAVELCAKVALGCRFVVQVTVLLPVFTNLLQMGLMAVMKSTSFSVHFPLFPLILSGTLLLLCRLMEKGRQLQEDSDSII